MLFLWTTGPFLREAQAVIEAWGFEYKTLGFNWIKTRAGTGGLHMGTGYHTRANAELCLLATKGRGLPRVRRDVHSVVISQSVGVPKNPRRSITGSRNCTVPSVGSNSSPVVRFQGGTPWAMGSTDVTSVRCSSEREAASRRKVGRDRSSEEGWSRFFTL